MRVKQTCRVAGGLTKNGVTGVVNLASAEASESGGKFTRAKGE